MPFTLVWQTPARQTFDDLQSKAQHAFDKRAGKGKATKPEGLFKQILKCVQLLAQNPRHPGLQTHTFHALVHPYDKKQKVFEAYAQNQTPGAFRVFWCYGPTANHITLIAITPHP